MCALRHWIFLLEKLLYFFKSIMKRFDKSTRTKSQDEIIIEVCSVILDVRPNCCYHVYNMVETLMLQLERRDRKHWERHSPLVAAIWKGTLLFIVSDGRLRSVRLAHRAIPRKDPDSNPGGDRQTYRYSAERLASFVTQAIGGAGVKCGNALRKLTTPVPLRLRARPRKYQAGEKVTQKGLTISYPGAMQLVL